MISIDSKQDMAATPTADLVAGAAIHLAGKSGWRTLALADIAAEAGVPLSEVARHYSCRPEILDGFERMIDRRMLAGAATDASDPPRDRLFGIVMERLDALLPYRDGVRRITRELSFDPQSGMVLGCTLPRSVAWMYAGARIAIDGPFMPLRIAALAGVYLATLRVWLDDESADFAKTMAALDRHLDRAKRMLTGEFGRARPVEPPATPTPTAAPAKAGPAKASAPKRPSTRRKKST